MANPSKIPPPRTFVYAITTLSNANTLGSCTINCLTINSIEEDFICGGSKWKYHLQPTQTNVAGRMLYEYDGIAVASSSAACCERSWHTHKNTWFEWGQIYSYLHSEIQKYQEQRWSNYVDSTGQRDYTNKRKGKHKSRIWWVFSQLNEHHRANLFVFIYRIFTFYPCHIINSFLLRGSIWLVFGTLHSRMLVALCGLPALLSVWTCASVIVVRMCWHWLSWDVPKHIIKTYTSPRMAYMQLASIEYNHSLLTRTMHTNTRALTHALALDGQRELLLYNRISLSGHLFCRRQNAQLTPRCMFKCNWASYLWRRRLKSKCLRTMPFTVSPSIAFSNIDCPRELAVLIK